MLYKLTQKNCISGLFELYFLVLPEVGVVSEAIT